MLPRLPAVAPPSLTPPPRGLCVIRFTWHDLLFAHWPMEAATLRALVPAPLELDLFDGRAWVGVIPFRMSGVRLRGLPAVPGLADFPEVNVRTYVRPGGRAGVYFFSLDAASWPACRAARMWYHLPYFHARMKVKMEDDTTTYQSIRREGPRPAEFRARYRPASEPSPAPPGSLAHWLTERYCLFSLDGRGGVHRADIHHAPWPLAEAEAEIASNSLAAAAGIHLPPEPPLLHFARRLEVRVWPPERIF
ncbi:MAG: YqjF family protein [Terriglobales bacterium]